MSFDTLAVTALRQDLEPAIVGGRVQKVLLPGELSVGLEIYARGRTCRLLICASNNAPHALLASKPLRRATDRETPLLQLLRKYVRGGRVLEVRQPPLERIIVLQIACNPERSGESRRVELVAELTGRHSNVVLVDEAGLVMDAMKRVGRVRQPVSVDPSETPLRYPRRRSANHTLPKSWQAIWRPPPAGQTDQHGGCSSAARRASVRSLPVKRYTVRREGPI